MYEEHITWIALPAHYKAPNRMQLSAYASIRLLGPKENIVSLDDFSPAMQQWAATVAGKKFTVRFEDGSSQTGISPSTKPDNALWTALFPNKTPVGSGKSISHDKDVIQTYGVVEALASMKEIYGKTAEQCAESPPWIDDPHGPLSDLIPLSGIAGKTVTSFIKEANGVNDPPGVATNNEYEELKHPALGNAYRFYVRPWFTGEGGQDQVWPESPTYGPEFHERLSLLGDYPELLRRLGILVTLEFADAVAGNLLRGRVEVFPDGEAPPAPIWTAFERDPEAQYFWTRPFEEDIDLIWLRKGWLALGNYNLFQTYQVDVDGGALKLVEFASHLGHLLAEDLRGPMTPMQATLPALRSAGWSVAWREKGQFLAGKFSEAKTKKTKLDEENEAVTLYAEQLVRGYRVEVYDAVNKRWRSLHRRQVSHHFKYSDVKPVNYTDEGYVKGFSATSNPKAGAIDSGPPPKPGNDLYVHEAVFGWEGWSLAAPRPGKHLPQDEFEADATATAVSYNESAASELGVATVTQVVKKSLPRLRFGRQYAFRARAVDLAGVSLPYDESAEVEKNQRTGDDRYRRFEPVAAPQLIGRFKDTEGESLGHLVIRSNGDPDGAGIGAADYAAGLNDLIKLVPGDDLGPYRSTSDRHMLPPKTTQLMAETHGRFDQYTVPPQTLAQGYQIALTEGNFYGTADNQGDSKPAEQFLAPQEDLKLIYLPDPLAIGVCLVAFDHKGDKAASQEYWYEGSWPQLAPFLLELKETESGTNVKLPEEPDQSEETGVPIIRISVPKSWDGNLEMSSLFPVGDWPLDNFGIWDWIPNESETDLQKIAKAGRHWMLTPRSVLRLTHAVQQPLAIPNSTGLTVHRRPGDTHATLLGAITNHAQSTGRLDIVASWKEPAYLPEKKGWDYKAYQATATGFEIASTEDEARITMVDPISLPYFETLVKWRRCARCQTLVHEEVAHERCCAAADPSSPLSDIKPVAESRHLVIDAAQYGLAQIALSSGETAWQLCTKCAALFWDDPNTTWPCPKGGHHTGPRLPVTAYSLPGDLNSPGQRGWRRCKKCGCLYYGQLKPLPCPAKGQHEPDEQEYILPRLDRVSRHEFGDTKHRKVVYYAVATSRFREFFPPQITGEAQKLQRVEEHEKRAAALRTHIVPSSARPAAPDVDYIVPTFRWEDRSTGNVRARSRLGQGMRVYLRQPWFSSGDGELLGVLLRKIEGAMVFLSEDPLNAYVTDFGSDPVWESAAPPAAPQLSHFPQNSADRPNDLFDLEELPGRQVLVAPHRVYWDDSRQLWYADIVMNLGQAYFPMVRLALARYQPNSLPGLHLSRVVQSDFIQPVPDRHAQMQMIRNGAMISVSGFIGRNRYTLPHVDGEKHPPEMTVTLQVHDSSLGDLGWRDQESVTLRTSHQEYVGQWSGFISVPPVFGRTGKRRLLITEREFYQLEFGPGVLSHVPRVGERIVYTDSFDL